jgi:hypothetical protein
MDVPRAVLLAPSCMLRSKLTNTISTQADGSPFPWPIGVRLSEDGSGFPNLSKLLPLSRFYGCKLRSVLTAGTAGCLG